MSTYSSADEQLHSGWTPPPSRGPIESVVFGLKNIINFDGRASRSEFWWMFVGQYATGVAVIILGDVLLGSLGLWLDWISVAFLLAYQLALLSVSVRRLHDIDFIGWWVLVPFFYPFVLVKAGTPGPNRFG